MCDGNKSCYECWWFCHGSGQCFRTAKMIAITSPKDKYCDEWRFDGLEDWEREDCDPEQDDTLVTMEMVTA